MGVGFFTHITPEVLRRSWKCEVAFIIYFRVENFPAAFWAFSFSSNFPLWFFGNVNTGKSLANLLSDVLKMDNKGWKMNIAASQVSKFPGGQWPPPPPPARSLTRCEGKPWLLRDHIHYTFKRLKFPPPPRDWNHGSATDLLFFSDHFWGACLLRPSPLRCVLLESYLKCKWNEVKSLAYLWEKIWKT